MPFATPANASDIPPKAGWALRLAASASPRALALAAWIATSVLLYVWHLGAAPLFDVDEGAFAEATREMLERGDFITTYLNGQLRFDKPILVYWLQAASVSLLGFNEFALRLPSALAASAWLLLVLRFTEIAVGTRGAAIAMMLTATAVGPLIIGHAATADAVLNLCLAGAGFEIQRHAATLRRAHVLRAFAWMALGTLDKGPVAFVLPALASLAFFALERRFRDWLHAALDLTGWAVFAVIALPWYLLELHAQGMLFVRGFFLHHNVERFAEPLQGHAGRWFYYLPAALIVVLPHSGLLVRVASGVRRQWADALDRYLWTWFATVLIFFSLAGTKLPHYILYGATPLFILMARHRSLLRSRVVAYGPALLLYGVLVAAPEIITALMPRIRQVDVVQMLATGLPLFGPAYRASLAAVLALTLVLAWRGPRDPAAGLCLAGAAGALALTCAVLPTLASVQQAPLVAAARFVASRGEPVVAWGINMPSFSVYRGGATPVRRPATGELVLTRVDKLPELGRTTVLFAEGAVRVARVDGGSP